MDWKQATVYGLLFPRHPPWGYVLQTLCKPRIAQQSFAKAIVAITTRRSCTPKATKMPTIQFCHVHWIIILIISDFGHTFSKTNIHSSASQGFDFSQANLKKSFQTNLCNSCWIDCVGCTLICTDLCGGVLRVPKIVSL